MMQKMDCMLRIWLRNMWLAMRMWRKSWSRYAHIIFFAIILRFGYWGLECLFAIPFKSLLHVLWWFYRHNCCFYMIKMIFYFCLIWLTCLYMMQGLSSRKVGATSLNSKSSRSHIVFTFIIESWCKVSLDISVSYQ